MKLLLVMLTAILIGGSIFSATLTYNSRAAIDFYQYWGVGVAKSISGGALSSPYPEIGRYDKLLDDYALTSDNLRLQTANRINHGMYKYSLDMNCTPLLYTVFALFPRNYSLSFGIFLGIRLILFLSALYLLCPCRISRLPIVVSGILLISLFQPLGSDARVGNLNMVQFFSVAALAYYIDFHLKNLTTRNELLSLAAVLGGMVFLVLLKPNFGLIALALSASIAVRRGIQVFTKAAAVAGIIGIALSMIPCIYFKSWMVWSDWFDYLAPGSGKLSTYGIWSGNFSTSLLVSKIFNLSTNSATLALVILLMASSMVAVFSNAQIKETVGRILCNPYLTASMAVSTTLALSPLVWLHYYVISLMPALWMISMPSGPTICRVMGGLSLLLSSGIMERIMGTNEYLPYFFASSWVPLWVGSLVMISRIEFQGNNGKIMSLS